MSADQRPAKPDHGLARRLRAIAGVNEEILSWAPEERPRYTRLGAIIVNTGLLAGLSLLVALRTIGDTSWPWLIPIAMFWAYVIISFDGWLIASTHGAPGIGRLRIYAPRIVIALLLGVVIAEPLLLWIFHPPIHREVHAYQQAELAAYESQWKRCNPESGQFIDTSGCRDFHLSLADSPSARQGQLDQAKAKREQLATQVNAINTRLAQMNDLARSECNGRAGTGLSGRAGEGPNCLRDRAEADQYRSDSHLIANQAELAALDQEILRLTDEVRQSAQSYTRTIGEAIAAKVATRQTDEDIIGLLDEDAALQRLSDRSGFVWTAQWLLRLLLIALDCMPVLVKLIGGATNYDRFTRAQLQLDHDLHSKHLTHEQRRHDNAMRAEAERFGDGERAAMARNRTIRTTEIDALAEQLYEQSRRTRPRTPTPVSMPGPGSGPGPSPSPGPGPGSGSGPGPGHRPVPVSVPSAVPAKMPDQRPAPSGTGLNGASPSRT